MNTTPKKGENGLFDQSEEAFCSNRVTLNPWIRPPPQKGKKKRAVFGFAYTNPYTEKKKELPLHLKKEKGKTR